MNSFDNSIARMKALYTYGTVKENKTQSNGTLEYSAKAADGKTYGIVKECNHFYIKQAVDGKENIAEGYNYIGGYMNKNNYRYNSYNNALKHFELKLSSINEACDSKVDVSTLDPFKKEIVLAEATDKMRDEIARQRQIMYNASMIMNESCDYAVKGGKACTTSQPEAETGEKGDKAKGSKEAKANPDYKGSHISLNKKAEPYKLNPKVNESISATDTDFDEGMNKGKNPSDIGWDMENQEKVNEGDEKEWDKGLPTSAGVGVANTDHNNNPFNKTVNESSEDELENEDLDDFDFEEEDDVDLDSDSDLSTDDEEELDLDTDFDFEEEDDVDLDSDSDLTTDDEEELDLDSNSDIELDIEDGEDIEFNGDEEEDFNDDLNFEEEEIDFDEDEEDEPMFESKKRKFMNQIIESVCKQIVKEDELHDFGKHPGYRKKPMTLPPTGEDKNAHGEDINDESVHSEEPFGKQIGDGSPFNQLVNAVTKDVMYQLKHGVKIDNKKKVE